MRMTELIKCSCASQPQTARSTGNNTTPSPSSCSSMAHDGAADILALLAAFARRIRNFQATPGRG